MQHMHQLGFVGRRHHAHSRHHATVGDIEHAVMSRAIIAHQAGAIQAENHVGLGKRVIDDQLVDGALHKRRIQANDGFLSTERQTARKGNGMLLGNAGIDKALRILFGEFSQPRAVFHGRGNGNDIFVERSLGHNRLAEYARVFRRRR